MKQLWNETRLIERFLKGQLNWNWQFFLERRKKEDATFASKVQQQEQSYQIIRIAARKALMQEIQAVERRYFQDSI